MPREITEIPGFLDDIQNNLNENIHQVNELMNFDGIILDYCITHLKQLNTKLKSNPVFKQNKYLWADNAIKSIEDIKENGSLRRHYDSMYNQGVVLTISYFSLAIYEIFKQYIVFVIKNGIELDFKKEDIKINFEELQKILINNYEDIGDIFIEKKDISFQDMQSMNRAIKNYCGIEIDKNYDVDNIILGLSSRHIIVHNLSIINDKFIKQISYAGNRTIKESFKIGDKLSFDIDELNVLQTSILAYTSNLIDKLKYKLIKWE